MKLNENGLVKHLAQRANTLVNGTKIWFRENTHNTRQSEFAVTQTPVKKTANGFEVEVFIDKTKLDPIYNEYPVIVAKGRKKITAESKGKKVFRFKIKGKWVSLKELKAIKARPFFQIVLNQQRNKYPKLYAGITND